MHEDPAAREPVTAPASAASPRRIPTVVWIVLGTIAATLAVVWFTRAVLFPSSFRPVELSSREQAVLDDKLEQIGVERRSSRPEPLEPEPYSEVGASREIDFTEKELNALVARNTDLAERLAIDLADDLASARLLLPLDPDFPLLGGETLRIHAGLELAYRNARPVVILRGVSIMGVPLPDAWLGNLKNIDLVKEFGHGPGFWQNVAAGIEHIEIVDGRLRISLKE
jgi:hypothetical protein